MLNLIEQIYIVNVTQLRILKNYKNKKNELCTYFLSALIQSRDNFSKKMELHI
jgi:hypothetical protein